jgi:hypothetical protein
MTQVFSFHGFPTIRVKGSARGQKFENAGDAGEHMKN